MFGFALVLALEPIAAASGLQACWAPGELIVQPGEQKIQKMVPAAFVSPPRGRLATFSPIPSQQRLAIRRVRLPAGQKLVALTFDLCEQPYEISGYQGGIVDYLRDQRIKATFFAGGKWMITHGERASQLMADPLFEVGNHTWEHRNLRLLSGNALKAEISNAQLAYESVRNQLASRRCYGFRPNEPAHKSAPARLSLFRFPFGACDERALQAVGDLGLRAVQWDVSSGDPWTGQKSDRMAQGVLQSVRPGSIVLFHANGRGWHTESAIPRIISALRKDGYGFVTVSELLAMGEPEYSPICFDSRPGDTNKYDDIGRKLEEAYKRAIAAAKALARPATAPPSPGIDLQK